VKSILNYQKPAIWVNQNRDFRRATYGQSGQKLLDACLLDGKLVIVFVGLFLFAGKPDQKPTQRTAGKCQDDSE